MSSKPLLKGDVQSYLAARRIAPFPPAARALPYGVLFNAASKSLALDAICLGVHVAIRRARSDEYRPSVIP